MFENIHTTFYAGQVYANLLHVEEAISEIIFAGELSDKEILLLVKISKALQECSDKKNEQ